MFVLSCGLLEVENKVILMKWLFQPFLVTEKRASFYVQILVTVPIDTQKQNEGVCCLMSWKGKLGGYSLPNISFNGTAEYTLMQVSVGWWMLQLGCSSLPLKWVLSLLYMPYFSAFYLSYAICIATVSSWPFIQCYKLND